MRAFVLVCALGLTASCHEPLSPSQSANPPSSPPTQVGLTILPNRTGMIANATVKFSAALTYSDGMSTSVTAVWSSDNGAIVQVDAEGNARAITFGAATIAAEYGQFRAVLPVQVVPDLSGTWVGQFRIATCDRRSGAGPSPCRFEIGSMQPIQLSLAQTDDVVSGSGRVFTDPATVVGAIQGKVDSAGNFTLGGSLSGRPEAGRVNIDTWSSTWDAGQGGALTGQFSMTRTFNNIEGPQVLANKCDQLKMAKQ